MSERQTTLIIFSDDLLYALFGINNHYGWFV